MSGTNFKKVKWTTLNMDQTILKEYIFFCCYLWSHSICPVMTTVLPYPRSDALTKAFLRSHTIDLTVVYCVHLRHNVKSVVSNSVCRHYCFDLTWLKTRKKGQRRFSLEGRHEQAYKCGQVEPL